MRIGSVLHIRIHKRCDVIGRDKGGGGGGGTLGADLGADVGAVNRPPTDFPNSLPSLETMRKPIISAQEIKPGWPEFS